MHSLKIDRSFVRLMLTDPESYRIIKAIISLAQTLSLDVIAEGIETAEQLLQIKDLECRYG